MDRKEDRVVQLAFERKKKEIMIHWKWADELLHIHRGRSRQETTEEIIHINRKRVTS